MKYALGKLTLQNVYPDELPEIANKIGFTCLPLKCKDASSFYNLPKVGHKDPFDRMLIWQTIKLDMILISKDSGFNEYLDIGLHVIW